ncbi:uncharacterized protein [Amphiura filiformis]|uniref:uncharacterized protein n=1 Tax=Amphiura filiformis TaxID=82378 RepID=UPI003B2128BE
MEAQRIITISINKIAGSRNQRGGINLRKNLLVASVLQSARTLYYEEMCNTMSRTTTLYNRCDSEMDSEDDCTEAPDWGDNETDSASCEQENNAPAGNVECSNPVGPAHEDKENRLPDYITPVVDTLEPVKCERIEQVEDLKCEESVDESSERPVLRDLSSQNYNCVSCKRKRNDDDSSCESNNVPNKKAKVDSDCCYSNNTDNTQETMQTEGPITSLVSIFKSGFHGLSGDSVRNSNSSSDQSQNNRSAMSSHLEQSSYVSPIARSLDILSRPIAAC